jgi:hypothetical protein
MEPVRCSWARIVNEEKDGGYGLLSKPQIVGEKLKKAGVFLRAVNYMARPEVMELQSAFFLALSL